jgi:hypothetical protein
LSQAGFSLTVATGHFARANYNVVTVTKIKRKKLREKERGENETMY